METLQTVFIMRFNNNYPAEEKMGKEKKKKRGAEERIEAANIKLEKTDSNSAHTWTSEAVHT